MDLGLENFAAIADNRGNDPIVIKGGALKALNQWSSKRISFLTSELMKGHDTKTYHPPETKQIHFIRRKRDNIMRDTFYKTAHFICRTMRQRGLDYLIVGHSPGAKQGIDIGHRNNQAFVQIPYGKFISILQTVCVKYSVRLILQEESYTSKACFGKRDHIPTYGEDDNRLVSFSGERIKRGVYLQDDGKLINADINAAVNIGRKYDECIFPEDDDCEYLYGTVLSMTVRDVLRASQEYHRTESDPGQTGQRASVCPVSA
jgi:putative transposase